MRKVLLAVGCLAMIGACSGEFVSGDPSDPSNPNNPVDPVDPGAENAQPIFQSSVLPIMRKCSGGACHTGEGTFPPKFLGAGDETGFYAAIVADPTVTGNFQPENATLLLKLAAGPHQGTTYSQEEVDAISGWLQAEFQARNAGTPGDPGTPTPPVAVNIMAQWAGCMTRANFDASNMQRWANKGSGDGACGNCHVNGLARFYTNVDDNKMFLANRYQVFINGFFTVGVDPLTGESQVEPAIEKLVLMGSGELGNLHPTYNVNVENDAAFQSLIQFTELTRQTLAAGQCGPAEFPTEPLPQ